MRKSLMANFVEQLVQLRYRKKSPEEVEEFLNKKSQHSKQQYSLPIYLRFKCDITEKDMDNQPVYYLNESSDSDTVIIYLHGGAFVDEITAFHWKMIDRIAYKTKCHMIVPLYELMPYANHDDAFKFVEDVYSSLLKRFPDKKFILMGDSAGGGLALSLSEYFATENIPIPDKLILFSPWLDVSMSNPEMDDFVDRDIMLSPPGLVRYGIHWAGDLDTRDYRVSPMFGDVNGLDNVDLFVGSEEIFYPDISQFYDKLKKAGKNCNIYVGENLGHDFPLLPTVEGRRAIDEAINDILEMEGA